MLHVGVGVIVYNEEKNILNLLQSISRQKLKNVVIDEVRVVSSGSTDKTNELVLAYSKKDSKVSLIVQKRREGKASAISEFLRRNKSEIVIVSSGDVIFNEETVENLISPFIKNGRIGMSSAKPNPVNNAHSFMGFVSVIHWKLHRLLKRHGETIAFRKNLVSHIPIEVSADEAYVEAIVHQKGFKAVQANNAVIFNKGSENVLEFLGQVRRHYVGHLFIRDKFGYVVSSMTSEGVMRVAKELLGCLCKDPFKVNYMLGYVFLETIGRVLGMWDFYVKKKSYNIWDVAKTTKNLIGNTMRFI